MRVRGITVCVNYHDLLAITLVRNIRFLESCWVVTHPNDHSTKDVCRKVPNVHVLETNAFYEGGAKFNKGLAIEQGFDAMGRKDFILIWDADILLHDQFTLPPLEVDKLYYSQRRILEDPHLWTPAFHWDYAEPTTDRDGVGFFQLFHADSNTIKARPWYDTTFCHAAGGDGYFAARWPEHKKHLLPLPVLHLGPRDRNWFGRATPLLDGTRVDGAEAAAAELAQYHVNMGWIPGTKTLLEEHVSIPGHKPSGYQTGAGVLPDEES